MTALAGAVLLGGCATGPAASPTGVPSVAPTASPPPTPTARPTQPAGLGNILPQSGQIVPVGEYTWTGSEPSIVIVIDEAVWQVGHRHREFFDLFPATAVEGQGPGVGAGQFVKVHGASGPVAMTDAAAVVAALQANAKIELEELGVASLPGLTGLTGLTGLKVDLSAKAAQTPIFDDPNGGTFHMDPGWTGRYWFLDVEGGVLIVSVIDNDAHFETGLALAEPILAGFRLAGG